MWSRPGHRSAVQEAKDKGLQGSSELQVNSIVTQESYLHSVRTNTFQSYIKHNFRYWEGTETNLVLLQIDPENFILGQGLQLIQSDSTALWILQEAVP